MNMPHLRYRLLMTGLLALLLAGCTPYLTRVDFNPGARFEGLQTYAWIPQDKAAEGYQTLDDTRIRRAFEAGLAGRGMQAVAADQAQVWVDAKYLIDRRYDTRTVFYGYYNWHPYWWGMEPDVRIEERDESQLSLLFIDPATRSVIWAGQSTVRFYDDRPPLERTESLERQVETILQRFPPR